MITAAKTGSSHIYGTTQCFLFV